MRLAWPLAGVRPLGGSQIDREDVRCTTDPPCGAGRTGQWLSQRGVQTIDGVEGASGLPLYGLPLGVKDVIDVDGLSTVADYDPYRARVPPGDAAVARSGHGGVDHGGGADSHLQMPLRGARVVATGPTSASAAAPLGGAVGASHAARDGHAVAILHERMPVGDEWPLVALACANTPLLRIGRRGVSAAPAKCSSTSRLAADRGSVCASLM